MAKFRTRFVRYFYIDVFTEAEYGDYPELTKQDLAYDRAYEIVCNIGHTVAVQVDGGPNVKIVGPFVEEDSEPETEEI